MICSGPPRRCRTDRPRTAVDTRSGLPVVRVAHDRNWDAGDLTLLTRAVDRLAGRHRTVGIDLGGVHRLPTGFWERLCRWAERGVDVLLVEPGPEVRCMYWFRLSAAPHAWLPDAYAISADHGAVDEHRTLDEQAAYWGPATAA